MRSAERRQLWRMLAAATLATALFSLALNEPTGAGPLGGTCGNTSPQCDGTCPSGQTCTGISRGNATNCVCRVVGCCQLANGTCADNSDVLACLGFGNSSSFVANGTCGVDCLPATHTPTATATATPTQTPRPNGGSCVDPIDCVSGNCVDDVCCDTACSGADQSCTQPGHVGTCIGIAPAPAASQNGLLAIVLVLAAVAAVALWRRPAR